MSGIRLIVRDFAFGTTEDDLQRLFETHAEVLSVELPSHPTGEHKDFALVDVADEAQALDAVHHLHGHIFEGRRLRVKIAEEHKLGEAAPLVREEERALPHEAPKVPLERPERHFLRTTRTQRRV